MLTHHAPGPQDAVVTLWGTHVLFVVLLGPVTVVGGVVSSILTGVVYWRVQQVAIVVVFGLFLPFVATRLVLRYQWRNQELMVLLITGTLLIPRRRVKRVHVWQVGPRRQPVSQRNPSINIHIELQDRRISPSLRFEDARWRFDRSLFDSFLERVRREWGEDVIAWDSVPQDEGTFFP